MAEWLEAGQRTPSRQGLGADKATNYRTGKGNLRGWLREIGKKGIEECHR